MVKDDFLDFGGAVKCFCRGLVGGGITSTFSRILAYDFEKDHLYIKSPFLKWNKSSLTGL